MEQQKVVAEGQTQKQCEEQGSNMPPGSQPWLGESRDVLNVFTTQGPALPNPLPAWGEHRR